MSSLAPIIPGVKPVLCYSKSVSVTLSVLAIVSAIELLMWLPPLWRLRRVLACAIIPVLSLVSGLLFGWNLSVWAGLVLVFSIYRVVNLLRLLEGRMQAAHLYKSTRRTGWWLIGSQLLVLAGAATGRHYAVSAQTSLYIIASLQLLVAGGLWLSTRRHLRTTKPPAGVPHLSDKQLPTLSVAIPARNETDELEACLQTLISSDYPKLEVLVLDDCSQNQRTPGIIRDFAQSGVRFIAGQTPPEHWLAKNFAYHQLAAEANGDLLLFCGVDTRFEPGSLRSMVQIMVEKRKTMASFIPRNQAPRPWDLEALLIQPARYAWELAPPRRLLERPPVLSTCWLISTTALHNAGGFEAVSRSISPESYFARQTARHGDGYSFLQSDQTIDLTSAKSLAEQRATAVRTRYPQLHRRPELVALSGLGELAVLSGPFVLAASSAISQWWTLLVLSATACLLLATFYARIVALTYRQFLWRGLWTLPLVAIYDIGLLNYSMWLYEFREVIWKGRNVCLPVMRQPTSGSGRRP